MEVVISTIVVLGNTAYDWGWHRLTLIPKAGGARTVVRFRYCEIWQKTASGKWQIQIFISNRDQDPEMLPEAATVWGDSEQAAASADH